MSVVAVNVVSESVSDVDSEAGKKREMLALLSTVWKKSLGEPYVCVGQPLCK